MVAPSPDPEPRVRAAAGAAAVVVPAPRAVPAGAGPWPRCRCGAVPASRRVGTTAAAGRSATVWAGAGALASEPRRGPLTRMAVVHDRRGGGARGERARGQQRGARAWPCRCRRPRRPPPRRCAWWGRRTAPPGPPARQAGGITELMPARRVARARCRSCLTAPSPMPSAPRSRRSAGPRARAAPRVALALGQGLHRVERRAQLLAALERLVGPLHAVEVVVELLVRPAVLAQQVERGVVGDPVEPGPQVEVGVPCDHRLVGAEERLLHGVLGTAGRQHARAVGEQRLAVALDDRLEAGA